jgi:VCBS repeat-containing protein
MVAQRICVLYLALACILTPPVNSRIVHAGDQQQKLQGQNERMPANTKLIGQQGGVSYAVAWQNNYAFLDVGTRMVILDVTNPSAPIFTGQSEVFPGFIKSIVVKGDYAYLAMGSVGLLIVDISNPARPITVGHYDIPGSIYNVTVMENYVYITNGRSGLRIIDVTNPANPIEVGHFDTVDIAYGVEVQGKFAYVSSGDYLGIGCLYIIKIDDPSTPIETGRICLHYYGSITNLKVRENYAYLIAEDGLYIIEISDPTNPILITADSTFRSSNLTIDNSYIYFTNAYGLQVADISDPIDPILIGTLKTIDTARSVTVAGNYAYVPVSHHGLNIIDVSDPTTPVLTSMNDNYPTHPNDISVYRNTAYVADDDDLHIIDISDPTSIIELGSCNILSEHYSWGEHVEIVGSYAYFADGGGGLRIIDISNLQDPIEVGFIDTGGAAFDVVVSGNYAYLAANQHGLSIVDISNPANPIEVGNYDTSGQAFGVDVAGDYAYLASNNSGLRIIDISNPSAPFEVAYFNPMEYINDVKISGNYAYLAGGGLYIINISDPTQPIPIGFFNNNYGSRDVYVAGNIAYLADDVNGLRVIDVSDPTMPHEIESFDTAGRAFGVDGAVNYAYLADQDGGVVIIRIEPTPVAVDDSGQGFTTDENNAFMTSDILANDYDLYGYSLTVQSYDASNMLGELTQYEGGVFSYDPIGQFEWLGEGEQADDIFSYVLSNGILTDTATVSITIIGENNAPIVYIGDDLYENEGWQVQFTGAFTDPDWSGGTIRWDFGDGVTASGTLTPTHTYGDNGIYTVTLTIIDNERASGSDSLVASIGNVPPDLNEFSDIYVTLGEPITFTGIITDPGWLDSHEVFIGWYGSEPGPIGYIELGAGETNFKAGWIYDDAGEYQVWVQVKDDDAGGITRHFTVFVNEIEKKTFLPIITKR